ncbi:MAG TPA: hypothetical protein VFZ69_16845 [Longimicrobiales bacterium]
MNPALTCALLALLGTAACVTTRRSTEPAYVRLLEVEPEVGTRLAPGIAIHVRAAYRLPRGTSGHQANLMFLTETGALVSATGTRPILLTAREGVIELSAEPLASRGPRLAYPLTAIVMIMGPPTGPADADTIQRAPRDLPPDVRERLDRLRDSAASGGSDSLRIRTVVTGVRRAAAARSRAIFYNGAGPAPGLRGPALPFDEVVAEYRTYLGQKALALAVDARGRRTWGYGFGFAVADSAIARALRECEVRVARRGRNSTCRVYAVGDSIPPSS